MTEVSQDLLCLSHLRWGFVYQRPQHLMSRFARQGRVFFWEEPIFEDGPPSVEVRKCEKSGVQVVVPHMPWNEDEELRLALLKNLLDDFIDEFGIKTPVKWYYTPAAVPFSKHVKSSLTVYDCMDELAAFKFAPPRLQHQERELFAMADVVFTGGQSLFESKQRQHRNVHAMPSSVDVAHFATARSKQSAPADMAGIAKPRAGFIGVVDERFDIELLRGLSATRPDWQFVIVGPVVKIDPAALPKAANIHYLGGKRYEELPAYLSSWDVSMLLFAHNESTRFISPTKTPEYLAAGCPPVSTSIRDVVRPYGKAGVVQIADTVQEFSRALDIALAARNDPAWQAKVNELLAGNSWDLTWQSMVREMARAGRASQIETKRTPVGVLA